MHAVKVLVPVIALAGCGSAELPRAAVADTEAEIVAAQTVGAENHPRAALHLKQARDQLASALKLAEDGEEELARMTLERARVDAELALALTREAEAERQARLTLQEIAGAEAQQ